MKEIKSRKLLLVMMLATLLVVAACSSDNDPPAAGEGDGDGGWTGTITMYAQAYTPNAQNISGLPEDQEALQLVADEYEAENPGITIEFIDEEFRDYTQTVRVKAAAGEMYDIFWGQWADLNNIFPRGIAEDLTEHFNAPNPYIPDAATWAEAMNETVVNETVAPDGSHYNINGDYVATAFFYNQDLFEQAGIEEAPSNWRELIEVSEQLEAAGIVPMSQAPDYDWFQRHFLSDFYAEHFEEIADYDEQPGISSLDQSVAIAKGLLSTEDERFMGWWPVFKELTDTWKRDHITAEPSVVASSAQNDFYAGRTAMYYDGSWLPNNARQANVDFTVSSFNFPVLSSDDTAFATGTDVSGAVGGPNAAFQFAMATPQANSTMNEAGKQEAVLDWLHFLGTPQNVERVVNERGTFVPTWPGTAPDESMEALASQASEELRAIGVGGSSPNLGRNIQRIFGLYLSDNVDFETAKADVQRELDTAITEYQSRNNVDLSQY